MHQISLGQNEVFNKLTNGGEDQGIYIQDKKLYINANYILAGVLAGKFINAKGIKVIDKDSQTTLYIDDNGKVHILATEFSLQGKSVSDIATDAATEEAKKYKTLNVTLSNEYQGIPTDAEGNYTAFPECKTTVTALYGDENVTNSATITFTAGSGVTGSKSGATYTVTALSSDTGIITVSVSYNNLSVEKQFAIAKQKQGIQGLQGIQGINGKDGISGKDGQDGKTSYFHIKYSSVANPTSSSQMSETPSTYIGTYVDYTEADSDDPGKYTWSRFEGKDGAQGIPGTNGDNGQTSYLHIAYATSSDGKTGFSVSDSAGKTYIGQYTDFKENDSTNPSDYSWTKIKGDTGNGVSVIAQHYLASSSSSGVTTSTSGWTESVQTPTSSKRYLWNYQTTTYTDGTSVNTTPHVIGVYGEKGDDGKDASDMTQLDIFNKLTNNGQTQGIYLYNQKLYINADYIDTGSLAGWEVGYRKLSANGTYGEVMLDASAGEIYSETNTGVYVPGYGTLYGTRIRGINLYTGTVHASSASFNTSVSASSVSASSVSASGKVKAGTHVEASGHFYSIGTGTDLADASIRGKLKVSGTKSRSVSTVDYDEQLFYCYEMPTPFFGDIGESVISDDGTCMIDIDDIFQESANVGIKYYVFLQREGEGNCWIAEKEQNYFIVKGTPGLKFSFEIKARQAEYEHMRFTDPGDTAYTDARDIEIPEPNYESEEAEVSEPDYESELINDRLNIINQMEVIS